jgi:methionyl aminopeptidase
MPIIALCKWVESEIVRLGCKPAFPCNVGVSEVAAHYTSPWKDASTIPAESLVKVDFGVQVDGFIADTAVSVSFSPTHESLILTAQEALKAAISVVKAGVRLSDVGTVVQRTVERYGLRPISNLTGHKIERYTIHAGKSVPNVTGPDGGKFEKDEVYAIEPFVTHRDAAGLVGEGPDAFIHRFVKEKGVKSELGKKIIQHVRENYRTLPFASRWVGDAFGQVGWGDAFIELRKAHCVTSYPVLIETSGKPVAQAEHTVRITEDGCEILTEF